MEMNEDGKPLKEKMVFILISYIIFQSKLTVAGDKGKGVLGEANLNLSDYSETEYKIFKIPL